MNNITVAFTKFILSFTIYKILVETSINNYFQNSLLYESILNRVANSGVNGANSIELDKLSLGNEYYYIYGFGFIIICAIFMAISYLFVNKLPLKLMK